MLCEGHDSPADVLILPMTDDLSAAASLATGLREKGVRTQLYTENKKFKQKIQYADKLHIPFVAFLGEDEIAANTVSVKRLATGEQQTLPPEDAAALILAAAQQAAQQTILK